jgi:hypothetical protein
VQNQKEHQDRVSKEQKGSLKGGSDLDNWLEAERILAKNYA